MPFALNNKLIIALNNKEIYNIDDFSHYYNDDFVKLYHKLIGRFNHSPFFISKLHSYDLMFYIYDLCNSSNMNTITLKNKYIISSFENLYNKELQISYDDINNFTKIFFKFQIPFQNWVDFCFNHTDLYELKREYF